MKITVKNGTMPKKEIDKYIEHFKETNPDKEFKSFEFTIDGDYVDVTYTYDMVPFERIRRITGYLVGTIDRFNDAKRAEVEDRVKHGLNAGDTTIDEIQ